MRSVAGCVPVKVQDGEVLVCLVASSKVKGRWLFPKGGVEKKEKARDAAVRETWEEAGLKGKLIRPNIGTWNVKKEETHKMWVFICEHEETEYLEVNEREKKWLPMKDALSFLQNSEDKRSPFLIEMLKKTISMELQIKEQAQ